MNGTKQMNAYEKTEGLVFREEAATWLLVVYFILTKLCSKEAYAIYGRIAAVAGVIIFFGAAGGMEADTLPMYIGAPVCIILSVLGILAARRAGSKLSS